VNERTQRLLQFLVDDLTPVEPLPPLRRVIGVVLAVGGVSMAVGLVLLGSRPHLLDAATHHPVFGVIALGLPLVAVGGLAAALAGSVPGREMEARVASLLMAVGALTALGGGALLAFSGSAAATGLGPVEILWMCASSGLVLGIPAAAVGIAFVLKGWPAHPLGALVAAAVGATALGTFAIHLSCQQLGAGHLIVAHFLLPAGLALALALPLRALVRWVIRRRAASSSPG